MAQNFDKPCRGIIKLTLDRDYLLIIGQRDYSVLISKEQKKIVDDFKQRHGITIGSCAESMIELIKTFIPLKEGDPEYLSYPFFIHTQKNGLKRLSGGT